MNIFSVSPSFCSSIFLPVYVGYFPSFTDGI